MSAGCVSYRSRPSLAPFDLGRPPPHTAQHPVVLDPVHRHHAARILKHHVPLALVRPHLTAVPGLISPATPEPRRECAPYILVVAHVGLPRLEIIDLRSMLVKQGS